MPGEPRNWVSIQHLRGFAALSVALFHACQWSLIEFPIGMAGVDVFFVISGFVMWTVTCRAEVRPLEFVRRRIIRVAPLYWLVTLVLVAGALIVPQRFPEVKPEPGHVLLSLAFIQHYAPSGLPFPVLAPGWTLNYEAVFYLVFAVSLLLPQPRRMFALTVALGCLAFAGFLYPPAYVMLLNPLFLEFLAGVWIARLAQEGLLASRSVGWLLMAMGLMTFMLIAVSGIDPELWRPMVWGLPAAMVVAGAVTVESDGGWPAIPGLNLLGDASYSIYLTHTLSIGALAIGAGVRHAPFFVPLALALAAGCGIAVYLLVERPLLRRLRGRLPDAT